MKRLVVVGSLLLASCGARSLQDARPPGRLEPETTNITFQNGDLRYSTGSGLWHVH